MPTNSGQRAQNHVISLYTDILLQVHARGVYIRENLGSVSSVSVHTKLRIRDTNKRALPKPDRIRCVWYQLQGYRCDDYMLSRNVGVGLGSHV